MDKPTPKDRVEHVLKSIKSISKFMEGANQEVFATDIKLQSAVLYQFLIIGEAIRHIDDSILSKYAYPWHIPRSFRNFISMNIMVLKWKGFTMLQMIWEN